MKKIISILMLFIIGIQINTIVFADDIEEESTDENIDLNISTTVDNLPNTNSKSCLIYDRTSKTVIYEKNGYEQRAMASTTKIMTAIIVLENANLTDMVTISKKAGQTRWLKVRNKGK